MISDYNNYLKIRNFYEYLKISKNIRFNYKSIPIPKKKFKIVKALTINEIQKIFFLVPI